MVRAEVTRLCVAVFVLRAWGKYGGGGVVARVAAFFRVRGV